MDKAASDNWGDLPTSFTSKRNWKSPGSSEKRSYQDNIDYDAKVEEYFDKRFCFQISESDWQLPDPDDMFQYAKWKENHLQQLKRQLNYVKNKLNNYNLNDWHRHTRSNNKAGDIQWKLRNEYDMEFITQAWCKFYENVASFPLIPTAAESLLSVHLCEAPGAFIVSLNHYLKVNHPEMSWDWMATTLNPYYEGNPLSNMINDDRFILQTLEHWNFGVDMTGNLMLMSNMLRLVKEARVKGEVMLVTADGSIDCQEDPGEQETVVAALHYCEVVSALHILAEGGSLLLKMFTMFECDTICLMYLLCCSFKSVTVNKPATSKEGNSEVYVVCLEYHGAEIMEPWITVLDQHYGPQTSDKSMFISGDIPSDFLDKLEDCAALFVKYQVDTIESNIVTYHRRNVDRFTTKRLRHLIGIEFMRRYAMQSLEPADEMVGRKKLTQTLSTNLDPRSSAGTTFNENQKKTDMEPFGLLEVLREELNLLDVVRPQWDNEVKWIKFPETQAKLQLQVCKPVGTVLSSKFCTGRLLKIRNQVVELTRGPLKDEPVVAKCFNNPAADHGDQHDNIAGSFASRLKQKFPGCVVLDFSDLFWSSLASDRNDFAVSEAFLDIQEAVHGLWREDSLALVGLPLLTQFNVGLVRVLGHMFERVGFVPPARHCHAVVFQRFKHFDANTRRFLHAVEREVVKCQLSGGERSVLALLPINLITGTAGSELCTSASTSIVEPTSGEESDVNKKCDFYSLVLEMNHMFVVKQTRYIIAQLLGSCADPERKYHLDPSID